MENAFVQLELLHEVFENEHIREEIILLYTISGKCNVKLQTKTINLNTDDVFVINFWEEYSLSVFGNNCLLCKIRYSYMETVKCMNEKFIRLICNSTLESDERYTELKKLIGITIKSNGYIKKQHFSLMGSCYQVLGYLLDNFKSDSKHIDYINYMENNSRIALIRTYVQNHYDESAFLSCLAKELFMSLPSLSRWYKHVTGQKLSTYVREVRLKKAEILLQNTGTSLTEIAVECGYATAASLCKAFKSYYGIPPVRYQKEREKTINLGESQTI